MDKRKPKVIDLFAGVGGLSYGFMQAGFEVVLANEIDETIAISYSKNHPQTKMINKDITKLDIEEIFKEYKNKIDVIVGGPPCQGFSQKGKRKTIHDERNFLFRYYFKVVDYIKPEYFLIENVPNILTAENGLFKNEIINLFESIGYSVNCDVLKASDYGVPQDRRRAIIIGRKGENKPELPKATNESVTTYDAIGDLEFLNSGEGQEEQEYLMSPKTKYQKVMRKNSKILHNHVATKHSKEAIKKLKMIPPGKGKEVLPKSMLTKSIYSGTWSRMLYDGQSVTITTRFDTPSSGRFTHPILNRCITVREAARIQSFPDDFIFYGSKNSQMKQVGNAVPPRLGKIIAESILKFL